jgi:hypothetical protein
LNVFFFSFPRLLLVFVFVVVFSCCWVLAVGCWFYCCFFLFETSFFLFLLSFFLSFFFFFFFFIFAQLSDAAGELRPVCLGGCIPRGHPEPHHVLGDGGE